MQATGSSNHRLLDAVATRLGMQSAHAEVAAHVASHGNAQIMKIIRRAGVELSKSDEGFTLRHVASDAPPSGKKWREKMD